MKPDHERIWLQNADDAKDQCEGRMWCEDKVWPDNPEDGEPTQYIRTDLYERALIEAHQRGRREGMEEAATMIDEGVEKPASSPWRNDGKPSKHDKCPHDLFMYEDCETCCASALRAKAEEAGL